MKKLTVFIGYDKDQSEAAQVCFNSIVANDPNEEVEIQLIERDSLVLGGLYWRERMETESTEFSFTRFLTPYLKGFYGYALFCDSDFVWKCSPMEVLEHAKQSEDFDDYPVWVVKHEIRPEQLKKDKMGGKPQTYYPMKNWSSLMLFNCSHPSLFNLVPKNVSEKPASYLHGFMWAEDMVGSLPHTFNYLVGYYDDISNPKVLHFTDGTPLHKGYENCEYAEEFLKYVSPRTE